MDFNNVYIFYEYLCLYSENIKINILMILLMQNMVIIQFKSVSILILQIDI